jgi:hypothetical protein
VWNGSIHHGPEVKSVYHGPATVSTEKLNGVGVCGRSMAQKLIMGGPRERERGVAGAHQRRNLSAR